MGMLYVKYALWPLFITYLFIEANKRWERRCLGWKSSWKGNKVSIVRCEINPCQLVIFWSTCTLFNARYFLFSSCLIPYCWVLITMISYECLWYNCFMSHCLWSQTDHKRFLSILLHLITINTLKLFIDLLDGLEIQNKLPTLMTFWWYRY